MKISNSLRSRAITGIIFVVAVLALTWINLWSYLLLLSIIVWMCIYEWSGMNIIPRHIQVILASFLTTCFIVLCLWDPAHLLIVICLILTFLLLLNLITHKDLNAIFLVTASSLIYFIIPNYLAFDLAFSNSEYISSRVLFPLLLIWVNDVFAFVIGSLVGRHKLIPRISPHKSWEGTLGGIFICGISGIFLNRTLEANIPYAFYFGLGVGILSIIGDLFESALKRNSGVKDSSNILPGHGGFMDRFDSFLIVMAFTWIYWNYFPFNS